MNKSRVSEIYKELQKLGITKEANRENALNYLITIEQEDSFYFRLKHQDRPTGVE